MLVHKHTYIGGDVSAVDHCKLSCVWKGERGFPENNWRVASMNAVLYAVSKKGRIRMMARGAAVVRNIL